MMSSPALSPESASPGLGSTLTRASHQSQSRTVLARRRRCGRTDYSASTATRRSREETKINDATTVRDFHSSPLDLNPTKRRERIMRPRLPLLVLGLASLRPAAAQVSTFPTCAVRTPEFLPVMHLPALTSSSKRASPSSRTCQAAPLSMSHASARAATASGHWPVASSARATTPT